MCKKNEKQSESNLLDGSLLAKKLRTETAGSIQSIIRDSGVTPCLATILVGNDPASATYVRMKRKYCEHVGIKSISQEFPENITTENLLSTVQALAQDDSVHGILIQHPVPAPIDKRAAFEAIPLLKDVDGVSSAAFGRNVLGMPAHPSCTPAGIIRLLLEYNINLDGVAAVVIGRSPILGRPMASMLINHHATVTLCHSRSRDISNIVHRADMLIVAVGKPKFVQGPWIKPGAVVIDCGYNEGNIGDVDFEQARKVASLITPVPGGVGPMTIATLLSNTANAAAQQLGISLPTTYSH